LAEVAAERAAYRYVFAVAEFGIAGGPSDG
jgi:hypothetical protein